MIGATISAGVLYLFVWKGLGFAQDKSYYAVTLSFLLCHYFYDHILFRDFEPLEPLRQPGADRGVRPSPPLRSESARLTARTAGRLAQGARPPG